MTGIAIAWTGGGGNPYFAFTGGNVTSLSSGTPNAGVTLQSDGTCTFLSSGGSAPTSNQWFTPTTTGIGSTHWVFCTVNSGSLSGGTAGVWLALSAGQSFSRNRTTVGTSAANITLQLATDSGGANIVDSATFNLDAEKF